METDPFSLANSDSYDDIYRDNPKYMCNYPESPYYDIWIHTLSYIPDSCVILDVGCGTGQYAKLLEEHTDVQYIGIDFSPVAIEMARKIAFGEFFCENALDSDLIVSDYDIIVMLEFMEHIKNDTDFLDRIPTGKQIIGSVPNYLSSNHFRSFMSISEVMYHYETIIEFKDIREFLTGYKNNKIYLFNGKKL